MHGIAMVEGSVNSSEYVKFSQTLSFSLSYSVFTSLSFFFSPCPGSYVWATERLLLSEREKV